MKRTKIVCTIGPASESVDTIRKMIRAGMNYARLNLSHADLNYHAKLIKNIRVAARLEGEIIGIIADLQGPKIRLGKLPKQGVELKKGQEAVLNTARAGRGELPVTYSQMHQDVKAGNRILIDDGLLELRATKIRGRKIYAEVIVGGRLSSNKGINLPDSRVRLRSLTSKDARDVKFAIKQKVAWVALSFVRAKKDVEDLRKLLRGELQKIIVKIEKGEALKNFNKILEAADGVMVARGDLGIEVSPERVPLAQKEIIRKCLLAGKPVVVATQMLDSMIRNPRPTRAEVSDVANAVVDHADAVMLSGETASGAYPIETVKMMKKIAEKTEKSRYDDLDLSYFGHRQGLTLAAAESAVHLADESGVKFIYVSGTESVRQAQLISHFRPELPIFTQVHDNFEAAQVNLNWAVAPLLKRIELMRFTKKGDKYLLVETGPKGKIEMSIR